MAKVKVTETIFRDAHQSLIATRMTTDEMLPIAEMIDSVGFNSVEMWGRNLDSCLGFERGPMGEARKIKSKMKNTPLQMLREGRTF